MPKFSVIIPTYGRPEFLREAIDSVLAQTIQDFEIIVVDDASPEPVVVEGNDRLRLVRVEVNGGVAASRNLGVANSKGDVLAFLDDDDTWTPRRLEWAEAALERAPVAVCWQSPSGGRILEGDVHQTILTATTPALGATALRRDAWLPMDESYRAGEDLAWWLDITERSFVATHPQRGLVVRSHDGGRIGYGADERIAASQRLLTERSDYFAASPSAASFRWKRIGLMAAKQGDKPMARRAFARALRARPSAADVKHLVGTLGR